MREKRERERARSEEANWRSGEIKKEGEGTELTATQNESEKCSYQRENGEEIEEGEEIEREEEEQKLECN